VRQHTSRTRRANTRRRSHELRFADQKTALPRSRQHRRRVCLCGVTVRSSVASAVHRRHDERRSIHRVPWCGGSVSAAVRLRRSGDQFPRSAAAAVRLKSCSSGSFATAAVDQLRSGKSVATRRGAVACYEKHIKLPIIWDCPAHGGAAVDAQP
jgi:hypothetical protein